MKKVTLVIMTFMVCVLLFLFNTDKTGAVDVDTWISDTAYNATVEYGEAYGICPELLQALIEIESSGNPKAVNGACKGLCQIYGKYHGDRMERLGICDLYDERENILIAADYLAELIKKYGEISLVLDVYNGNSMAQQNFDKGIISDYAGAILKRSEELERIHGK